MTSPPQTEYLEPITRDNAAVLFIDNQNHLLMGVQSIETTLLRLNTEALAKLAELYDLPVVLTTTGGGAEGAWGPLFKPITDTFPDAPIFNRQHLNAMDDPGFADAVSATGRRKIILSGVATDFCLFFPALSLLRQGYHVLIAVDASGCWTKQVEDAALLRLVQAGATPTSVEQILGELHSTDLAKDLKAGQATAPAIGKWLARYGGTTSIVTMDMFG